MKLTEGGKLERPNICTICERTPEVGTKVVDTERYFEGWPYVLQGRRYVCDRCIKEMLKFFDFADRNEVAIAQVGQQRAEAVVRGVKLKVDSLVKELRTLAEDPSVFMVEAESGSIRDTRPVGTGASESGLGETPSEASEGSTEAPNLEGDKQDVPSEDRVAGSKNSGAKRGSTQGSRAQSRPRKPANTAA